VYRGEHLALAEPVGIKCLKLPQSLSGEQRDRFHQSFIKEGQLLHKLSKANAGIAQALDLGAAVSPNNSWTPFLVMEWLSGRPLDQELKARRKRADGALDLAAAMKLLAPAASALGEAHKQCVAHRDVKPANLFLTEVGARTTIKVLDFGIAKIIHDDKSLTQLMAATGMSIKAFSPRYGAPEQFDPRMNASGPWTDVFAFALILVELLCNEPALRGDDVVGLHLSAVDSEERPTPRAHGVELTDAVEAVIARALAVRARERYVDLTSFWDALERASQAQLPSAAPVEGPSSQPPGAALPSLSPEELETGAYLAKQGLDEALSVATHDSESMTRPVDSEAVTRPAAPIQPGPPQPAPPSDESLPHRDAKPATAAGKWVLLAVAIMILIAIIAAVLLELS